MALTQLKLELLKAGISQRSVAEKARIQESTLSLVVTGKYNADPVLMDRIARAAGIPRARLFLDKR